ncbi:TIGR02757 family protein [Sunxiuqinia sp. A32]|uniref:TIGR02757 family protein n=1 Tax=Sunxiuqinia sp. A32 TaxID=3461496 RepID=UPI00404651DF
MISDLKALLEWKVSLYNNPSYIDTDPIQVPKQFSQKENIEIAAFFAASIAWGQRPTIIKNAFRLMGMMENQPYDFLMNTSEKDWSHFLPFKHRTFNGDDAIYFLKSIKNIYENHGGLEAVFTKGYLIDQSVESSLRYFREIFFELPFQTRTGKHVANIDKGSSAKRLNMLLRWMVRKDDCGVDFGLWNGIPMSKLFIPLDVHSGRHARALGLLSRNQNDWKSVVELTRQLVKFDRNDPVKYDFALFGMGVFE